MRKLTDQLVWDIFENCYVTVEYWNWVNGITE